MKLTKEINPYIFRGYDIRGVYPNDLNEDIAYTIGRSFGSKLIDLHFQDCIVGRDNRLSSPSLSKNLIQGILDSGVNVIDLGIVTTPMYYYACIKENVPRGIMVTASHNPKDENGFKFAFDESGNACGDTIQEFLKYTLEQNFHEGKGQLSYLDIFADYCALMKENIQMGNRKLKVVIDCGNGTTSLYARKIYEQFPINLEVLFEKSDANFPNHHPDPSVEENLTDLKSVVKKEHADVGLAFDGDGDRLGVIDENGNFVSMDQYMIMIVRDLFTRETNKNVLYDVKCSKTLPDEVKRLGGNPLCSRVGNSYTKRYTREWNCIFGGELSGHVYFRDKFLGFDSGIYAGIRLLEILSHTDKTVSQLLEGITKMYATPEIKIKTTDEIKFNVVEKVKNYALSHNYPVNDIDGVRIDLEHGWILVRASNTGPNLTVRFEADNQEYLNQLQEEFMNVIDVMNKY